jgi:coronin-1B/1C/6
VPENFSLITADEDEPKDVSPSSRLAGHSRKVGHVLFHPTAENVLVSSSGDYTIKLWDIATEAAHGTLKHPDVVQSMSWSTNGSMLVTTCRDKKLRVWDPRQENAVHEVPGHTGAKNSRAVWLTGDVGGDKIATTGFSKMSDRQLGLWDLRALDKSPLNGFEMLDSISGVCMPFWDESTKCIYLAGKG